MFRFVLAHCILLYITIYHYHPLNRHSVCSSDVRQLILFSEVDLIIRRQDASIISGILSRLFRGFSAYLYRYYSVQNLTAYSMSIPLRYSSSEIRNLTLPNETLTSIFDSLPPASLTQLARVSIRFQSVAERVLYSSIFIRDTLSEISPIPWRTIRCCESILHRPHLVESTRNIHIRWQTNTDSPPPSHHHLIPVSARLAEALHVVTFLISLDLLLGPVNLTPAFPDSLHAIERIIRGCRFPYLRHCSLGADWTKGVRPYTQVLDTFLASLPSLRDLRLLDHQSTLTLPTGALPLLSAFRGFPDTAAALLPGRPIQFLALTGQDSSITRENLPRFSLTSAPIRHLDLSGMSVRPLLLRNIALYLPTVEVLRIRLALRHTLHYALSGIVSTPFSLSSLVVFLSESPWLPLA